jgi:hypothetical protein
MEGASNVKAQHKLRQVEKAARRVGELLLGFAADIFPETDYDEVQLYLTGRDAETVAQHAPEGALQDEAGPMAVGEVGGVTLSPTPDMWVGTYEVFVEQASTELRNPVIREQKYRGIVMDLLGMTEVLAMQGVQMDLKKLVALWLEAAGLEDVDRLFLEQPQGQLEPGRVDVELGEKTDPELLAALLGEAGIGGDLSGIGGQAPDEVPPDVSMGAFDENNTGILEAAY